jgi:hypothetical protein
MILEVLQGVFAALAQERPLCAVFSPGGRAEAGGLASLFIVITPQIPAPNVARAARARNPPPRGGVIPPVDSAAERAV